MECSDAVGKPVYALEESAGLSPTCDDESIMSHNMNLEALDPTGGSFLALLKGLPQYRMIHFFDLGFK